MYNMTMVQDTLELEGIPSAHTPGRRFYPKFNGRYWTCDCEHYRIYHTPCRHILQKKFENIEQMWKHLCDVVKDDRDLRDMDCLSFDEVITFVSIYRDFELNRLCTFLLNIAVYRGNVTSDNLHAATGEMYAGDKIVGVAVGSLLRSGLIECVSRKKTERKCAHGRSIGIYQITQKGLKVLGGHRPEKAFV